MGVASNLAQRGRAAAELAARLRSARAWIAEAEKRRCRVCGALFVTPAPSRAWRCWQCQEQLS